MKRFILLLLAGLITIALFGCSREEEFFGDADEQKSESYADGNTDFTSDIEGDGGLIIDLEIPEFSLDKVIYNDICNSIDENEPTDSDLSPLPDGSETPYGLFYLYSVGFNGDPETELLATRDSYLYVAFAQNELVPENHLPNLHLKEFLQQFGYIENTPVTESVEIPYLSDFTVGYFPYIAFDALITHCVENEYTLFRAYLTADCFTTDTCRDFSPLSLSSRILRNPNFDEVVPDSESNLHEHTHGSIAYHLTQSVPKASTIFPVIIDNLNTEDAFSLLPYLKKSGFYEDKALTKMLLTDIAHDEGATAVAGYISWATYLELAQSDKQINCVWLTDICLNGECNLH